MKPALQINLSFQQILAVVRQLPAEQKRKLSKTLEKDIIDSKLTRLLKTFKTSKITEDEILNEVDFVRSKLYGSKKD
jgi:hypothetical protein